MKYTPTKQHDPLEDTYISRKMILWLIKHLPLLQEGIYPPDAKRLKEFPPLVKKGGSGKAPFVEPILWAVEVERRLLRAKTDGLILLCIECFGVSEASLAGYFGTTEEQIRRRANEALRYVTGYSVKKRNYRTHYQHKKGKEG